MEQDTINYFSAIADFKRARRQATLQAMLARLTGKSTDLLPYEEVRQRLKATESGTKTLEEIPLDAIVGSVGRYSDFTRSFLPKLDSDQARWARVNAAMSSLAGVPPIEVYQVGDAYFVKDGNHRVSVLRRGGARHVEAFVTPVRTRVPLSADVEPDDLILKVEQVDFLESTHLGRLRPEADLTVTAPGIYPALEEHIAVHRYFMGLEQRREIPYEEAVTHWYDTYYLPVVRIIRGRGIMRDFPGRTETDLYLWTLEHRAALIEETGWRIDTGTAAADLADQFSPRPQRVAARLGRRLLEAVTPDELEAGPPPGQWRQTHANDRPQDCLFADILVAVDGKESGWNALAAALTLARCEQAQLHGLHVVPSAAHLEDETTRAAQREFDRRCQTAGYQGQLVTEVGRVPRLVTDRARFADLVVLSLSHPYASRPIARVSSGLRTIIRRCPTPVLAVPGPVSQLERVLLAYDGSPRAQEALFVATYLSGVWHTAPVVLSVMEGDGDAPDPLSHARRYMEARGVHGTFVNERGPVASNILITAEGQDAQLIVIGGYGYNPIAEIAFGSTVEEVLRSSRRPVLICR